MNRNLSIERLYQVADFQNIKFSSAINDLPDEIVTNSLAVDLLFYGQSLECDIAYKKYMNLRKRIVEEKVTDVLAFLEEERKANNDELLKSIKQAIEKEN
jgi:CRISPR/Cas system CMR-associated protein Cmr5 small subunit